MNEFVCKKLCEIIKKHGRTLYEEEDRLEALLKDFCYEHSREINLIMIAARAGIASELLNREKHINLEMALKNLSSKLNDEFGMKESLAISTVKIIAMSLDLIHEETPDHIKKLSVANNPEPIPHDKTIANTQSVIEMKLSENKLVDLGDGVILEMVYIPPGTFLMGYGGQNYKSCEVRLTKGFFISKYSVTQGQWEAVTKELSPCPWEEVMKNPSKLDPFRPWENLMKIYPKLSPTHPVVNISWNECQKFINILNQKSSIYNSNENGSFRLPTAAEWEYACRAGSTTKFYWGDNFDEKYCWHEGNSDRITHQVGLKLPNKFGLYDMSGNVSEWCNDWSDEKAPFGSLTDPRGPVSGSSKVYCGGSWCNSPQYCTSSSRSNGSPHERCITVGFRLAFS